MRVSALGKQLTFYDDEGNVTGHHPPLYPQPPEDQVRMINIVDFEDRLMGIDPDAKPDFFLDIDELKAFVAKHRKERLRLIDDRIEIHTTVIGLIALAIFGVSMLIGAALADDIVAAYLSRL